MYMEAPVFRARELRRHDLIEDAARRRLVNSATATSDQGRFTSTRRLPARELRLFVSTLLAKLRGMPPAQRAGRVALAQHRS
jgi:hypothetical protein